MDTLADTIVEESKVDLPIASVPPKAPWHVTTSWTDERVEQLKTLWLAGLRSCSEIAKELGDDISRNAVVGKVHRLGLPHRGKGDSQPRPRRQSGPRRATQRKVRAPGELEVIPLPPQRPEAIPLAQRKTLLELKNHHCRFPYGDPGTVDFFFCGASGANVTAGIPYCAGHAVVCVQRTERC